MEPTFTLPYSEYCVAIHLRDLFKSRDGYSLFIPMSRQEKGVDLLMVQRHGGKTTSITIQVKASRTYSPKPTKSGNSLRSKYYTWFNTFDVPKEADFVFLIGLYPPEEGRTKKSASSWWSAVILVFTQAEMKTFISNVKTRKGTRDKMFGFGFDEPTKIYQTRGDINMLKADYSGYLLTNSIGKIKAKLRQ